MFYVKCQSLVDYMILFLDVVMKMIVNGSKINDILIITKCLSCGIRKFIFRGVL